MALAVGTTISAMARCSSAGVRIGARRIGAHAAGVGAEIAIEGALVVLGAAEGDHGLTVHEAEQAGFPRPP